MSTFDSINKIYEDLKTIIEHNSDGKIKVKDGTLDNILKSFSSLLFAFDKKNEYVYKNLFVDSADLDHLLFEYGGFLEYKHSNRGLGQVLVTGEVGKTIPKGTILKDSDGIKYISLLDAKIARHTRDMTIVLEGTEAYIDLKEIDSFLPSIPLFFGTNDEIKKNSFLEGDRLYFSQENITTLNEEGLIVPAFNSVTFLYVPMLIGCLEFGDLGQKLFNDILTIEEPINGVDSDVRIVEYSSGRDAESIDDYRLRIKNFLSKPNAPFSKNELTELIYKNMPKIKFIYIKGGEYEPGKVKIYALDYSYLLLTITKHEILTNFYNRMPLNIKKENITCVAPTVKRVDIVISKLDPNTQTLKDEIIKNLNNFFEENNFFEKKIDKLDLERVIFLSEVAHEKVNSFELEQGFLGAETDVYYKIGDVIIS